MVTYLVVVVQFRVSLEAKEEEGGTSANTRCDFDMVYFFSFLNQHLR